MKIFVTGASGSLGSYICRELLRAGHEVTGYSRSHGLLNDVRWIEGDAGNCAHLTRSVGSHDAIIHLAAIPGPGRAAAEKLVTENLHTTTCVLEAAVHSAIPQVVFASSGAALGFTFQRRISIPRYLPIDEAHPCEPQDPYGLSKLLCELTCRSYTSAFGLGTTCIRVNNAWYLDHAGAEVAVRCGWARNLTVEQLWESRYSRMVADASDDWPCPGPVSPRKNLWAVTDARDVARAFRLAVEQSPKGHEIVNLGGSETCSLRTTPELLVQYFPQIPLRRRISGFEPLISQEKATHMLGFQAEYSWRRSDFSEWLELRSAAETVK
jgi:nucleoside-diphosphate-sugar epimerase